MCCRNYSGWFVLVSRINGAECFYGSSVAVVFWVGCSMECCVS